MRTDNGAPFWSKERLLTHCGPVAIEPVFVTCESPRVCCEGVGLGFYKHFYAGAGGLRCFSFLRTLKDLGIFLMQ